MHGGLAATDFRGKTLSFSRPPERIVCLIESALSGLYMLGAEDKVVGISRNIYEDPVFSWYAAMDRRIGQKSLPTAGNWDFVSLESVLALQPDLVLIWSKQTESIAALEERDIPVFGIFLNSREDIFLEIRALGQLTGKKERAEELIRYAQKKIGEMEESLRHRPSTPPPSVYFMWAQGLLETSGRSGMVNELIEMAGGRNAALQLPNEHMLINLETLLSWNPDLIVMWVDPRKEPGDILQDPRLSSLRAVQSGRIHELPEIFLCDFWTLKFLYASRLLSAWIFPQSYRNQDLEREKREILHFLYQGKLDGKVFSSR